LCTIDYTLATSPRKSTHLGPKPQNDSNNTVNCKQFPKLTHAPKITGTDKQITERLATRATYTYHESTARRTVVYQIYSRHNNKMSKLTGGQTYRNYRGYIRFYDTFNWHCLDKKNRGVALV